MKNSPRTTLTPRPRPWAAVGLLLALTLSLGGCYSFDQQWQTSLEAPPPPQSIAGAWAGFWVREETGGGGPVRAVVDRVDSRTAVARFKIDYAKVLSYEHTAPMHLVPQGAGHTFQGEADLGPLGGWARFQGYVDPQTLQVSYFPANDPPLHVELTRPGETSEQ